MQNKVNIFIILISFFLMLASFILPPSLVNAQNLSADTEACSKYYDYGKVKVNLTSDKNNYVLQKTIKLKGTIVNNNKFPITDIILYSLIRRKNKDNASFAKNGHYLIDRIKLKENLNFLPLETKYIEVDIPINPNYPNGEYILQHFILSKEGFHYSGRSFLEEDVAGYTNLIIDNNKDAQVYFDINNLKINGKEKDIREFMNITDNSNYSIEIPIIDLRTQKTNLQVNVKYYYFEADIESLVEKVQGTIITPEDQVLKSQFTIPADLSAAYVFTAEINSPTKSIIKFRILKSGDMTRALNMNDIGISEFPINNSSRAYVCFYSPGNANSPETNVKLNLLNKNREIVDNTSIKRFFPSEVLAISLPTDKLDTKDNFFVQAEFNDTKNSLKVEKHFENNTFASSVSDININYDPQQANKLFVEPINLNGDKILKGGYIESIIIKNSTGNTVQEKYTITSFDKPLQLGNLLKGKYTAYAKSGNIQKSKDFVLYKDIQDSEADGYFKKEGIKKSQYTPSISPTVKTQDPKKPQAKSYIIIIVTIIILLAGFVGYIIWKNKKNKNL